MPSSKSAAHRALICAALSARKTDIYCTGSGADVQATVRCLRSLGARISEERFGFSVSPIMSLPAHAVLNCGESGSSLRFLLPVAAALGVETEFQMEGRLGLRPILPIVEVLKQSGCEVTSAQNCLQLSGKLRNGTYALDSSESSQFLSGLLFVMPLLHSKIRLTGKAVSESYINLTISILQKFGISCYDDNGVITTSGSYQTPGKFCVEGDWSAAAVWFTMNAIGSQIDVDGVSAESVQGDRACRMLLQQIQNGNAVIDCSNYPDLLPVLAVAAALTKGETRFVNAARLRGKESDRLHTVSAMLTALGADCRETVSGLVLHGCAQLRGGTVDCFGDHRIAMAAAAAATACTAEVRLCGAACVEKSYPNFWRDYQLLGGEVD